MSSSSEQAFEPMSCREFVELVTDYLEGALSPSVRVRFEEHLAKCPDCPRYLRQMRLTIELTGKLHEDAIPERARDDLLEAFRNWHRP